MFWQLDDNITLIFVTVGAVYFFELDVDIGRSAHVAREVAIETSNLFSHILFRLLVRCVADSSDVDMVDHR